MIKAGEISILDIGQIAAPRPVDTIRPVIGSITAIRISEDTLLIVSTPGAFAIYSIIDPVAPRLLLREPVVNGLNSINYARGRLYYICNAPDAHGTLYVVDVSDWTQPRLVGTNSSAQSLGDVRIMHSLLLVDRLYTDDMSFLIYRVSDSSAPVFIDEWFPSNAFLGNLSLHDSIIVGLNGGLEGNRLITLRMTAEGKLVPLHTWLDDRKLVPIAYAMQGNTLIAACTQPTGFPSLNATTLVSGTLGSDGVITSTDTLVLSLNRFEELRTFNRSSIAVGDSGFFLSTGTTSITGIIENGRIIPMSRSILPGLALDLAVHGRVTHLLTNRELVTLDFTRPDAPDTLSRVPLIAERIATAGPTRLLAADSTVRLLDLSDPRQPRQLGTLMLGRNRIASRIVASASIAALVLPNRSVELVRIVGDSLRHAGSLALPAADVALRGDTLYVAALDSTLSLWDISIPESPRRLQPTITGDGPLISVSLSGDTLIASSDRWSNYYRVPELATSTSFRSFNACTRAAFLGRYLFYLEPAYNLQVVDFDSEFAARSVGVAGATGDANFHLEDGLLMVAAQYIGLKVYSIDTSLATLSAGLVEAQRTGLICFPNPARHTTVIAYTLTRQSHVRISIEDLQGRQLAMVADRVEFPGKHLLPIDLDLPSGSYFIVAHMPGGSLTSRLIVTH